MNKTLGWIAGIGLCLGLLFLGLAIAATGGKLDPFRSFDTNFAGDKPLMAGAGVKQWRWSGASLELDLPVLVRAIAGAPSDPSTVTVRGPQEMLDKVRFGDGKLVLAGHDHIFGGNQHLEVTLQGAPLKSYTLNGFGKLALGHIDQDRLAIHIAGAGNAQAEGQVGDLDVSIEGAGDVHFGKLAAKTAHIEISGAGNAEIAVSDFADIDLSGLGNVRLLTRPKKLVTHISGLGHIVDPDGHDVGKHDD